jgi:adenosine deaminase
LPIDELCTVALNSFESAFLPWQQRSQLIDTVTDEMRELIEEAA